MVTVHEPRLALQEAARHRGISLRRLSALLDRNEAYLQQFVQRGTPSRLSERDRKILSDYLEIDEAVLGGPTDTGHRIRTVARLDVRASAGPGALSTGEHAVAEIGFDRRWLKQICRGRETELSIIQVEGDSMAPTLADGDEILVDRSATGGSLRDGIYVLRRDDTLLVKRLSLHPARQRFTIASDNPAHPTWHDCDPHTIDIIGRVIWVGRRLA